MDDIVERLRDGIEVSAAIDPATAIDRAEVVMNEAATEIETLRGQVVQWKDQFCQMVDIRDGFVEMNENQRQQIETLRAQVGHVEAKLQVARKLMRGEVRRG